MQKIVITDTTLRKDESLSFKEKINVAKKLDRLCFDVIETGKIKNKKTDVLFLHTIAPLLKKSCISCAVDLNEEAVKMTADAISEAKNRRLKLEIPTSTVQMEYLCGKKPKMVLEMIENLVKTASEVCDNVEFAALDATRSEKDFLYTAIKKAIECGAKVITVCDSAGEMLPEEYELFIKGIFENVPEIKNVTLATECKNSLDMSTACMVSAMKAGVKEIKTALYGENNISAIAAVFKARGDFLGLSSGINYTELEHTVSRLGFNGKTAAETVQIPSVSADGTVLTDKDDIKTVALAVKKLGYDLSDEDVANVYEEFVKVAKKKKVGEKELDVIVASAAHQTAPTYKLKNYIINSGNVINASCVMVLEKDGEEIQGMTVGDGPVDAAFQCIEKISGKKVELDDFEIQAVTEGKEAVGVTVVKLRNEGKLYSGKGVSTDIVESSINAFINALNKICFEEA